MKPKHKTIRSSIFVVATAYFKIEIVSSHM